MTFIKMSETPSQTKQQKLMKFYQALRCKTRNQNEDAHPEHQREQISTEYHALEGSLDLPLPAWATTTPAAVLLSI